MTPRSSPDPLGRRALFWAPAEREDDSRPRRGGEPEPLGKHALYSAAGGGLRDPDGGVAGDGYDEPGSGGGPGAGSATAGRGIGPRIQIECSSCHARSEVDVVRFAALHVPLFLWRPGRGFTRFMTCPVCRRRTWVQASWPARRV